MVILSLMPCSRLVVSIYIKAQPLVGVFHQPNDTQGYQTPADLVCYLYQTQTGINISPTPRMPQVKTPATTEEPFAIILSFDIKLTI